MVPFLEKFEMGKNHQTQIKQIISGYPKTFIFTWLVQKVFKTMIVKHHSIRTEFVILTICYLTGHHVPNRVRVSAPDITQKCSGTELWLSITLIGHKTSY